MAIAFLGIADRIDFQTDIFQPQIIPQTLAKQNQLRIDVRPGETDGFGTDLVKLAVASPLRPFVTEHGTGIPQAFRSVIGQIVFHYGTNDTGRAFRPQGQLVAIQ